MKKALALVTVLLAAALGLTVYLVTSRLPGDAKNTRLAMEAMETGDYDRARRLYGFAIDNGEADGRDREIYQVLDAYIKAQDALKNESFYEGIEIIDSLTASYGNLPIKEDMEGLLISLSHGQSVDDRLEALERAVNDGNVTTAEKIAGEVAELDMTSRQRERYFSLRRALTNAKDDGGDEDDGPVIYYIDSEDGEARLYEKASETSDVIARIPDGEAVEVLDLRESGFVRVRYDVDEGYIPFRYLSPNRIYRDKDDKDGEEDGDKDGKDEDGGPVKDTDGEKDGEGSNSKDDEESEDGGKAPSAAGGASFTVKVQPSELEGGELPIRSGPGRSYSVSGSVTSPMVLTVVEEENGWGRLKSGAGWIELSECTRVD